MSKKKNASKSRKPLNAAAAESATAKPPVPAKPKRMSGIDAAAQVLAAAKAPMNIKQVYAEIEAKGLWKTKGATPSATLYVAVIREIAAKGKDSRFRKHGRGLFAVGKIEAKS